MMRSALASKQTFLFRAGHFSPLMSPQPNGKGQRVVPVAPFRLAGPALPPAPSPLLRRQGRKARGQPTLVARRVSEGDSRPRLRVGLPGGFDLLGPSSLPT